MKRVTFYLAAFYVILVVALAIQVDHPSLPWVTRALWFLAFRI